MRPLLRPLAAAVVLAATLAPSGCGSPPAPAAVTTAAPGESFPVSIGSLTVMVAPHRIVSLSPTGTEMLVAVGAGPQVIAVDAGSTLPTGPPVPRLPAGAPDAAAIAGYQPDLVVIGDDPNRIADQLRLMKIPTFQAGPAGTLDDTYRELGQLGQLTGHSVQATAVSQRMRTDIDALIQALPPRNRSLTYYYELDRNYGSLTGRTFVGSLFSLAGLTNIADPVGSGSNSHPQLSVQLVVNANPDLIFLADTACCGQTATAVAVRAGWSGLTAVKTGGVISLDRNLAAGWGPHVVDLLRAITDAVGRVPLA